jgi:threonine dehydratase
MSTAPDPVLAADIGAPPCGCAARSARRPASSRAPFGDLRLRGVPEVREPAVHGVVQGRGAFNKMAQLTAAERAGGVLSVSAGNHAQAVAYHAQRMGIAATIVMPRFASSVKVENTRNFGAEVVLRGDTFDDARLFGLELAKERGLTIVHPYDDRDVIAGQGTVALEMLAQQPALDTLVVAIGGGGLIAGMATAARARRPDIRVVGVQTERFPAAWNAKHGQQRESRQATIADGIGVKSPGALTLPVIRDLSTTSCWSRKTTSSRRS